LPLLPYVQCKMLTIALDTTAELSVALLTRYSFDLSGYTAKELINRWHRKYPTAWVRLAIIEALYQGRYKAVSVQQLLAFWQRRGQVVYHFNVEFESLICSQFPADLSIINPLNIKHQSNISNSSLAPASAKQGASDTPEKVVKREKLAKIEKFLPKQQILPPSKQSQSPVKSPPIGQFTPDKSDRSEVFTSKLKAISQQDRGVGNR